jgi:glycosyltransferase involved in cell wall biosynthesis
MKDLVSVIIGTYERFELVQKAIESVLNQTYKNIELIVVDDCSKDERYKSLINMKDYKFIQLTKNSGLPACPRNVGIRNSTGKWIAFLDDDDFFLEHKISKQMEFTKHFNFICSDAYHDSNLRSRYLKNLYIDYWNKINFSNTNEFDFKLINRHNLIINSSVLVRRDLLFDIGLIDENPILKRTEDYQTWLRLLSTNVNYCRFIDEPLLYYNMLSEKK